MFRIIAVASIMLALSGNVFGGQYRWAEMCVIRWGTNANELILREPYREYSDGPELDTIGFLVRSVGPDMFFVDKYDNIYIKSSILNYLKGFHPTGSKFVDYSVENAPFNYKEYFTGGIGRFVVDSLCYIYCDGYPQNYIAIVDTATNFIKKIAPDNLDSTDNIALIKINSNDVINVKIRNGGCYSFKNDNFYPGAVNSGWLANDGNYYDYDVINDSNFCAVRYRSGDSACDPISKETLFNFDMKDNVGYVLLGVDKELQLYFKVWPRNADNFEKVLVCDLSGTLIEEFKLLPQIENHYLYYIYEPFFRADGCIFQFLCQDDGLHVIKWSKE